VLAHYARDYRTGAPMPQALVDKIKKAAKFNQGYALGELIAAAQLDMAWHTLPAPAPRQQDVDAFEAAALAKMGLDVERRAAALPVELLPPHLGERLFGRLLRLSVDPDARRRCLRLVPGAWRPDPRQRPALPRPDPLARPHEDYGPMFRAFYGKDPDIGPMLRHRGLVALSLAPGAPPALS
jgi:peptidyl-dipeptidase Dcp